MIKDVCQLKYGPYTIELHFSELTGMASHPNMQKIWITRFFLENRLHWQFEVRLLFYSTYPHLDFSTTPDLKLQKPLHCTVLDPITSNFKAS
jgi:hypothetical protein